MDIRPFANFAPMRVLPLLAVLACQGLHAQVRINEMQCTRRAGSDGKGVQGDWVELYNAGRTTVDVSGYALVVDGMSHRLHGPLRMAPRTFHVLWCDDAATESPDHIDLKLARTGGTLLLVAADGVTVHDIFPWPALPQGCTIGRKRDGGRDRGYFERPTPGASNANSTAADVLLAPPRIDVVDGTARIIAPEAATEVRYTVDGAPPNARSTLYTGPFAVTGGQVLRAMAWAPDAIAAASTAYAVGIPEQAWSLVVAPTDLSGEQGITDVASGNFSRSGPAWERQAWLQQGADGAHAAAVGVAVAGSGTRSLPKRNFKLLAKDRFDASGPIRLPDGGTAPEVVLRADAGPNAFLRNRFILEVARRSGARVDIQPSTPVPLYINGGYQGLYRVMPAKNTAWARGLNGGAPVDLIDGAGPRAVSGGTKAYDELLLTLAKGATAAELEASVDLNSLIDLACFDLWTGRGDHDLNVRCWRPRAAGGRWRWILFDMDQWAPPTDRTVRRMCASAIPETPYVGVLLKEAGLRDRLLARMSALLATTLGPDRALALLDSLADAHATDMAADHSRWHMELSMPSPVAARAELVAHIKGRKLPLLAQLRQETGSRARSLDVEVVPAGAGTVAIEGLRLTSTARRVDSFAGVPLHLRAVPATGMEFAGWRNRAETGPDLVLSGERDEKAVAVFRPAALSSKNGLKQ